MKYIHEKSTPFFFNFNKTKHCWFKGPRFSNSALILPFSFGWYFPSALSRKEGIVCAQFSWHTCMRTLQIFNLDIVISYYKERRKQLSEYIYYIQHILDRPILSLHGLCIFQLTSYWSYEECCNKFWRLTL